MVAMQNPHALRIGEEAENTLRDVQAWKEANEDHNVGQVPCEITDQEFVLKVCR